MASVDAAIAGIGTALPEAVHDNEAIAARLGVEPGWIEARTGVRRRHVAAAEDRLSDLAAAAATVALARSDVRAADVDLVLVATTTADELLPNAAPLVAAAIGADGAGAVDVGAACTGFLSALTLAAAYVESGRAITVLVVGADVMTSVLDPDDRSTAALFGDGAGAVLVVASAAGGGAIHPAIVGSDGDAGAQLVRVGHGDRLLRMAGLDTYRHAVARLSEATAAAVAAAGLGLDDIDLFVYHQANARILRAVGERLGIAPDRVVDCIDDFGNTSAATIPIALCEAERAGRLTPGARVLVGAFGAGFTWGAVVVELGADRG